MVRQDWHRGHGTERSSLMQQESPGGELQHFLFALLIFKAQTLPSLEFISLLGLRIP